MEDIAETRPDGPSCIGFVGLGVMGEPMCRHLADKTTATGVESVLGHDLRPDPLRRLAGHGVVAAELAEIAERCEVIFVSLPGGAELSALCRGAGGLLDQLRPGQVVVDLGTTPVPLTRELHGVLAARRIAWVDAPVTRTRAAAEAGTLTCLVGGERVRHDGLRPLLGCFASDIVYCGPSGAGQVVKQMNNMVLFQTVVALAEALAVARRAGVDGELLFEALSNGSADSFALRNHGLKALLPGVFPEQAFSTRYALKDLGYALELAGGAGLMLHGGETAQALFRQAVAAGLGDAYFPAVLEVIDRPAQEVDQD